MTLREKQTTLGKERDGEVHSKGKTKKLEMVRERRGVPLRMHVRGVDNTPWRNSQRNQ